MRLRNAVSLVFVLLLAACGGGGGGNNGQPPVASTPPPPPSSASTTFTAGTQATSVTLPAVGGYSGTLQMPPANTATSMSLTVSTAGPAGVPLFPAGNTALLFFSASATSAVSFTGLPALSISLPSTVSPSQSFYVAAFVPGTGWITFAGPGLVQGSSVTLTSEPGSITMDSGTTIVFALYSGGVLGGGGGGSPITASPAQVQLLDLTQSQTVTLADSVAGAKLSIDGSSCAGIATVSALSGSTFTVGATALGSCSVTVTDNASNSLKIPVSVTTTSVVIQ